SGVDAFPILREKRPQMKILICSGFELDSVSQRLIEAGAGGFVQKPFELHTLAREIRAILDKKTDARS
ncbi:MAG TPA: response regulator, partial [bacterium]|nr:response regulator [bacterium]